MNYYIDFGQNGAYVRRSGHSRIYGQYAIYSNSCPPHIPAGILYRAVTIVEQDSFGKFYWKKNRFAKINRELTKDETDLLLFQILKSEQIC